MNIRERVVTAAEAVLEREGAVGPLELLQQIGFLHFSHVGQWLKGNECYSDLESLLQCGEKKLADTWRHFFEWVREKNLEPFEASYAGASRFGSESFRITIDGDPQREQFFRTNTARLISPPQESNGWKRAEQDARSDRLSAHQRQVRM